MQFDLFYEIAQPPFIERYRAAWRASVAPRIGMTVGVLCLEDAARARSPAKQAFTWFYEELYKTTLPVLERLYPSYEQVHELGRFRRLIRLGINLGMLETFGLVVAGDPQECVKKLRKYSAAGVTRLLCAIGAGAVEAQVARETMTNLARYVMPAFDAGFGIRDSAAGGQEPPLRTWGRVEVDPPHHQRPEAPGAEQNPTTRC